MNKAKRRSWPISPWMVAGLGVGIMCFESGCAGLTGLRSVAPDRSSVLGFWDKPAVGSPTPGTDHYAQNVHAEQKRAGLETQGTDSPLLAQATPLDPLEEDSSTKLTANTRESPERPAAGGSASSPRNERVHVTLGRPEPLPAVALLAPGPKLAGAERSGSWRAGQPARRSEPAELARARSDESREVALATAASVKNAAEPSHAQEGRRELAQAEAKLRGLKTYKLKVSRVERVAGQLQPPEELSLSVRTEPKAVRLEWSDGPNKGREVIYSSTLDPRMLFVHMANSAIPLPPVKIAIDSPLVMKNSRHSITEAGLDTVIENLRGAERHLPESHKDDKLEYLGLENPPGFDHACHQFVIRSASGDLWKIFLDPRSHLPCLVIGEDQRGELIERYVYHDITPNPPDLAAADAFEPDKRWGDAKSLLSRLARAATGPDLTPNSQTRTR